MKIAIYTPSHDTRHLGRCGSSIDAAVVLLGERTDVEVIWVILPNGEANGLLQTGVSLTRSLKRPVRPTVSPINVEVIVGDYTGEAANVGQLKARCCEIAIQHGATHLVELDHDDELAPRALLRLAQEFDAGFGFVCSDTASSAKYGAAWGWEPESTQVRGKRYWLNPIPEICSRSLFEIFYAPNHVRAWTVSAYQLAGGYAPLPVCDDHDLMCRTYLAGVSMSVVREPLYIQHEHKAQTQTLRNAEIQQAQALIGHRYLYELAREQARREDLRVIDLGGAEGCPDGYESLDVHPGADVVCDVTSGPLPFADSSVGVLRAHDFLEHVPPSHVVRFLNECYRVLAPGGWLLTSTPSTDGRGAFQDPTHVSFWNSNSFWYYTRQEQAKYVAGVECRFQLARVENHAPNEFCKTHNIIYCDAALWALKGQRPIGEIFI